ncbi:hypothetical protein A3E49_02960 [Candidatus Saccharibacteria bacterium RIFCSPHIGHO2_12_FULL_49_19]|nr:MAG: hypothetical protein A2708_00475 [Candidatus Saccharibacteria bacterium RIFCSPHIGHO2_01_FULL_49_21]OGL36337.1 MAG: hypothetical protein A3E49_02960 [Candidatus Saccharibacteria bacterium RIFCSPHIGHO2_12_FULL_49_19]OGL37239.1 MAG: hypothetical protein A3B63_01830 [Candidatus Saccharibacteria bacterium RIFCSPLOWO2_01_FULL_49_22]
MPSRPEDKILADLGKDLEVTYEPVPVGADGEWCADFNTQHGEGQMLTTVWAATCHYEMLDVHMLPITCHKTYAKRFIDRKTREPVAVRGLVTRVLIRQDVDDPSSSSPYIGLLRPENAITKEPIYYHPDQEYILSIENCAELVLTRYNPPPNPTG